MSRLEVKEKNHIFNINSKYNTDFLFTNPLNSISISKKLHGLIPLANRNLLAI